MRKWIARINAFLQENITGMSVVQLFRREERNVAAFAEINRKHADANMDQIFYYAVFYPAIELLAAVATALILLYGGSGVLTGALTLGALVAFVQYSERFWRPISDLSEKFNILQQAMASSERIFALLDTPLEVQAPATPVRLGEVQGRVGFEYVSFAYTRRTASRSGCCRTSTSRSPPGKSVALVGATGAGKTSIISLLARLYDVQQGRVTLDGVDVRELDPASCARRWPSCCRTSTCSAAPSPPTSGSGRRSPTSACARRRGPSTPIASSRPCPRGTRPR